MAKIDVEHLTKKFDSEEGEIIAVDDLNLNIEDGEFVVFVGPSGCGKTTTLRCIAGLEQVTEGEILFDDQRVTHLRGRQRDVAMVFQNYALYPHMNVKENISFGLKLTTKMSSEQIGQRAEEVAEMLGIEDLLLKKPGALSGGQQQRVALGRAIVRNPAVFLLDEPLSNLDAKLRATMRTELQQLQEDLETTAIYVTHDQEEAMAMGDRIVVLKGGKLQQVGEPEEVYKHPNNRFVAEFIGSPSINTFEVEVDSGTTLRGPGDFSYALSDPDLVAGHDRVVVGFRPEDMRIVERGTGITAETLVVEPMGNENFLYADLGGLELTARVDSRFAPDPGDEFDFTFDEEALYLFDADTSESIKTMATDEEIDQIQELYR
jgi:multiple sugar transport system ATP-binding protein